MPGWLHAIANWNPVSAVAPGPCALRQPEPAGTILAWPMQHPVEAALIWSVGTPAIAGPLAAHFFRLRTTE